MANRARGITAEIGGDGIQTWLESSCFFSKGNRMKGGPHYDS